MKILSCVLMVLLTMAFMGCESISISSMNIQRASIRSTADVAITVSFDAVEEASVEGVVTDTRAVAQAIRDFLATGNVADLTISQIRDLLKAKIPEKYQFIVDLALDRVVDINVDVDKIGSNNVRRIDSFCVGVLHACDEYRLTDRPVTEDNDAGEKGIVDPVDVFKNSLINEMSKKK